ncbi:3-keto-5-aminohexanoate cleavage protein [Pseudonocardia sp. MH-G8]|uniref:3-keto-5-aminohexanoate cleavage protein n=1 Tax=Pseudonocardia sp. MH-G8 TaxID=1854588 RepID=UPI000BA1608E|nr:3-keto-5-aminohexanoate cleavage protein [Pseudonocardia sp. MH-G8]OZM75682.1 3-keto-5-aminohexanoate cleavage protein [Pseudonocardia sp. MH-G8]
MNELVIVVNPNENTMREPNPHVPWTPEEIAEDVAACAAAGASVVHFHARTADGAPDHTAQRYAETSRLIRQRCAVLLAPSLANGPGFDIDRRLAPVVDTAADPAARPDFLGMDMGGAIMDLWDPSASRFVTTDRVFVNDTDTHRRLFACAREHGLVPWMASFNVSWTRTITAHLDAGEVLGRAVLQFVLGGPEFVAAHPATAAGLDAHLAFLPREHDLAWVVSAHRADVLDVADEVVRRGGHIAIGVGDHPHVERGLPTNAELVGHVVDMARKAGREIASPDAARRILGVRPTVPAG